MKSLSVTIQASSTFFVLLLICQCFTKKTFGFLNVVLISESQSFKDLQLSDTCHLR